MYELGIMAYNVAVIRYIVVTLERYMSRPWLIEKVQILIWHKHLHCSLIDDLTISLYGYRIRYLVESNCEGEDYYRNDNCPQADKARRDFAYHSFKDFRIPLLIFRNDSILHCQHPYLYIGFLLY